MGQVEGTSFSFKRVEEARLEDYIGYMDEFGNIFAGTAEEIREYFGRSDTVFYELVDDDKFRTVGTIVVVSVKGRTHVGGITMRQENIQEGTVFPLHKKEIHKERNKVYPRFLCFTYPNNVRFADIDFGTLFWEIEEYIINANHIGEILPDYEGYEIERLEEGGLPEVKGFEEELMECDWRKSYIDTYFRRSEVAYVVREKSTKEIYSFGMLSKPHFGKRMLGPVHGRPDSSSMWMVEALLKYAKENCSGSDIVAYCPKKDSTIDFLSEYGNMTKTGKLWHRKSTCDNHEIDENYIIAMGSIVFDVC